MFYELDSTRVTLREYSWGTSLLLLPLCGLLKLLRVRIPSSVDDPHVECLEPFRVGPEGIPEPVRAKMAPLEEQLRNCGFVDPVYHCINDPNTATRICQATYRHQSGSTLAKIHYRHWSMSRPAREYLFPVFITPLEDGRYFVSTAGKPDMLAPPACKIQRIVGASVPELWSAHSRQLSLEAFGTRVAAIRSEQELADAIAKHHALVRDFHVARGVFVRPIEPPVVTLSPVTAAPAAAGPAPPVTAPTAGAAMPVPGMVPPAPVVAMPPPETDLARAATLAELQRLQSGRAGWANGLLVLVITAVLFVALGFRGMGWKAFALIIGVLFVHELGHLAAMWLFRYRNLRMFFIPFLGAAVSGQNYNVPGWKKAVVSLMGPLPGIVLGVALGVAALVFRWPGANEAALFLLGINVFNLLPVLPLDGGWVMHAVLFSRHPLLDAGFRFLAAMALLLTALTGTRGLAILGGLMLLGLPAAYRTAQVVRRLRQQGLDATSPDATTIPADAAGRILDELRTALRARVDPKTMARHVLQVFESLNARPPGWLASLALIGLQGIAFLVAIVFIGILVLARHADLRDIAAEAVAQPKHQVDSGPVLAWQGVEAARAPQFPTTTILGDFPSRADAETSYRELVGKLPPQAAATLFGQTLLIALPGGDDAARERWFNELQGRSAEVSVDSPQFGVSFTLTCIAPGEEAAKALADESQEYAQAPPGMALVSPWSPLQAISEAQHKARRTYAAIQQQTQRKYGDERLQAIFMKILEARRRGDAKGVEALVKEQQRTLRELDEECLDRLRQEGAEKWDLAMIDLYEKSPHALQVDLLEGQKAGADKRAAALEARQKELRQWDVRAGERLGQLPMRGLEPAPDARRFSGQGGIVRTGLLLRFWLRFERPSDGAPALAAWLRNKGCADLKYEFQAVGDDLDE